MKSIASNSIYMDPETQSKTITWEQYRHLMQLIPQVEKLKKTIQKMEGLMKKKDVKIETLKKVNMFSKLKEVIICQTIFTLL